VVVVVDGVDDVFATPTPRIAEERAEYEALVREGVIKP